MHTQTVRKCEKRRKSEDRNAAEQPFIIYMYLQPANTYSQDQGKFLTLFYTIVTPSVNPLIYTLRNKDVKEAMKKVLGKGEAEVE